MRSVARSDRGRIFQTTESVVHLSRRLWNESRTQYIGGRWSGGTP